MNYLFIVQQPLFFLLKMEKKLLKMYDVINKKLL